jgi:hypothetical protein
MWSQRSHVRIVSGAPFCNAHSKARLPELAVDLVRRRIADIASGNTPSSLAAKAVTTIISAVFTVGGQRDEVP